VNIRQPASWSPRRTLLARLRTSLATVASCVLAAGCYLSHERLDDSVPFSACVADDATVALTPADRTPRACQRVEVDVEPDTTCHIEPHLPGGGPRDRGYTHPEQWRRVRFVNTTDRLAVASIEVVGEACPAGGEVCRGIGWVEAPCECPAGLSIAEIGPATDGNVVMYFQVEAGAEVQFIVTGANAHVVLTLCDSW